MLCLLKSVLLSFEVIYNQYINMIRIPAMFPTIKHDTSVYLHRTTENLCSSLVP